MSVFKFKAVSGFTLIEVLIVVAIVAILLAIAVPAYQDSVLKSNRSVGKAVLLNVASRQEEYFINNQQYTGSLTDLGYIADPFWVNDTADPLATEAGGSIFEIDLVLDADERYKVTAKAVSRQERDGRCATMTLNGIGAKTNTGSGSVSECW